MADLLELPITIIPKNSEQFAYIWVKVGALESITERPQQFNAYGNTSVVHTVNAVYSLEQIQGVGVLKKGKYFGDKYGLKFPINYTTAVRWNKYPNIQVIMDCMDFSNPGASEHATMCGIQQYWGDPEYAPFIKVSEFSGSNPEPPGLGPPCEGGDGGGSERPDYGMIYPRKI